MEQLKVNLTFNKSSYLPKYILFFLLFGLNQPCYCIANNKKILDPQIKKSPLSDKKKLYFKGGKVTSFYKKRMVTAEKGVDVRYKNIRLETRKAFLYFDQDNTLLRIVAPKESTVRISPTKAPKKIATTIKTQTMTYYLKDQTIVSVGPAKVIKKDSTITGNNIKYKLKTDELTGENISGIL